MSNCNKNQNASYKVLEKVPARVICKDVSREYIHSTKSLQIMKKSGKKIPESLKEKLQDYSSVKPAYDINSNAVYLILSYKSGTQKWPVIVYSEEAVSRDSKEVVEQAKNLVKDEKKLTEIINESLKKKMVIDGISYPLYDTMAEIDYDYRINKKVINMVSKKK